MSASDWSGVRVSAGAEILGLGWPNREKSKSIMY